ncbi:MAG: aminodeoxychorismate/anthranilate synthase component II [Desulfobacteraceae bacterium]|nr:aminodeoxychorismate/anthranilate synthase component II [Desulfobacteraceae bacterium]MCF8094014.1 aminodeoxychorismate/anthranilate synthase component II [Desulfobacteraceae bacterium]
MPRLVVIDNYDSFTHNLVQMFLQFDLDIEVYRSDRISTEGVLSRGPDRILISPGPGDPQSSGISVELIRAFSGRVPILGVCLGMQCINEAFGGKTVRAPLPVHGKTSLVFHNGTGLFAGLASPFTAARYHSLVADGKAEGLQACAWSEDGVLMGLSDPSRMLYGVQFHPESFMTEFGFRMAERFLLVKNPEQGACHAQ